MPPAAVPPASRRPPRAPPPSTRPWARLRLTGQVPTRGNRGRRCTLSVRPEPKPGVEAPGSAPKEDGSARSPRWRLTLTHRDGRSAVRPLSTSSREAAARQRNHALRDAPAVEPALLLSGHAIITIARDRRTRHARDPRSGARSQDCQAPQGARQTQRALAAAGGQGHPGARREHPHHGGSAPAVRGVAPAPGRPVVLRQHGADPRGSGLAVTRVVVDASVAVKWFVPEPLSAAARKLLAIEYELLAPELLWAELGNVLWKKHRRRELEPRTASRVLRDFWRVPIEFHRTARWTGAALELAMRHGVTVYDALYL